MDPVAKSRILRHLCTTPASEVELLLQRAQLQLEFAAAFEAAFPNSGADVVKSCSAKLNSFKPGLGLEALQSTVTEIEAELEPIGRAAKEYTIHCVAHGHIDMNWMWSWPETVSMTHDTFSSVLNLMDQYPELTYSQSQASVYEAMRKYHPEVFERIKERVKEGRWEVAAVHWVEGDKNLASGESLCRHMLYTRDFFQEHFGLAPEDVPVDWEPDTFGHANTVPSIVSQGGAKYYYACRLGGGMDHTIVGDERPPVFYWQGPDGARVLVNRETTWYNSYVNIGDNIAMAMVPFASSTGARNWLNVYGIGNHGGGPTRKEIEYLQWLNELPIYPRVVFSTARRYFEAFEAEISSRGLEVPLLEGELNFEFTGCYTSQSLIKHANRYGENYCVEAETLAALSGLDNRTELREAWINVLFNQFHDILPGSGVRETREHARALFQETGALTGAVKREALKTLASSIDTYSLLPDSPEADDEKALGSKANEGFVAGSGIGARVSGYSQASGGGRRFLPFIVYNPCPWTRSEPVKVALYDTGFEPGLIVARDENGSSHPTVLIEKGHDWGHDRLTVLFYAQDVPPLGFRTYLLCEGVADVELPRVTSTNNTTFHTPHLDLRFNPYNGGLDHFALRGGENIVPSYLSFGSWNKGAESPQMMSSWMLGEISWSDQMEASNFRTHGPAWNEGNLRPMSDALAVRAEWPLTAKRCDVSLRALVHPLCPRIDFEAEIDWREIGDPKEGIPSLYVDFDIDHDFSFGSCLYETPFGSVERGTEKAGRLVEAPSLRYVHGKILDGKGVTLVQDCKYGFRGQTDGFRMHVVRSSYAPDHAPEIAKTSLRYAVYLHDAPVSPAELTRLGAAWNHPFIVSPANMQSGSAPTVQGFASVATPNVVLTSLKQAEHAKGLVLRLVEYDGMEATAEVALNPALLEGRTKAVCVDVMEREVEGDARLDGSTLRVTVPARSFVSVLLT